MWAELRAIQFSELSNTALSSLFKSEAFNSLLQNTF